MLLITLSSTEFRYLWTFYLGVGLSKKSSSFDSTGILGYFFRLIQFLLSFLYIINKLKLFTVKAASEPCLPILLTIFRLVYSLLDPSSLSPCCSVVLLRLNSLMDHLVIHISSSSFSFSLNYFLSSNFRLVLLRILRCYYPILRIQRKIRLRLQTRLC